MGGGHSGCLIIVNINIATSFRIITTSFRIIMSMIRSKLVTQRKLSGKNLNALAVLHTYIHSYTSPV